MESYPLDALPLDRAIRLQFKAVDCITREFTGREAISRGDLGVVSGRNKPIATCRAERAVAALFSAEAAVFTRGAGTGAIRSALSATIRPGGRLLVHTAPVYPTTAASIRAMGLNLVRADFNDLTSIERTFRNGPGVDAVLIQYTRQSPGDRYRMEEVISAVKGCATVPIITDDNYAVMKVEKTGVQCGADLSCFSCFKLLGPEGIGCVVGSRKYTEQIEREQYSGGCQTQGHEAMDALRGLVYAPVALAIQARCCDELVRRLRAGEVPGVRDACVVNAQSRVVLVWLEKANAAQVLNRAEQLGAAPNPVGAESKYELAPMFYRASGTFLAENSELLNSTVRINPMRSGPDTVLRILAQAIADTEKMD